MIDYRRLGLISEKPHTVFKVDGKMVAEHVFTRDGFSDLYSIFYQRRAPTHETRAEIFENPNKNFLVSETKFEPNLKRRHIRTQDIPVGTDLLGSRTTLFINNDCSVGIVKMKEVAQTFFANGDADELYFVAEGQGQLETSFGVMAYSEGDYLFIPKSVPYRFVFTGSQNMMVVEGMRAFGIPKEYRHPQGQLKMDAPYTHRDFRSPDKLLEFQKGENFPIVIKRNNHLSIHEYTEWPYQVLGWDGWVYPFAFNIENYQPKTSTVHLPPSSHMVFSALGFVMMNFVPRLVDYHKNAIPCPYPHSSVDCDEVLFYVKGNFTSRKNIGQYSMSFHPGGVPHGPHPEKYEASVGHKQTDELAVMVDTFASLALTEAGKKYEDTTYHFSWNTTEHL